VSRQAAGSSGSCTRCGYPLRGTAGPCVVCGAESGEGTRLPLVRLQGLGVASVILLAIGLLAVGFLASYLLVLAYFTVASPSGSASPGAQSSPVAAVQLTPAPAGSVVPTPTRAPATPTVSTPEPTPVSVISSPTPAGGVAVETPAGVATAAPADPTPTAAPTSEPRVIVANTDGEGAYLRATKNLEDRIGLLPEGTVLIVTGAAEESGGELWLPVRADDGTDGWIPLQYTAPVVSDATPPPAIAASSPVATAEASPIAATSPQPVQVDTPPQPAALPSARIVQVTDGDSATADISGQQVQLRFIGIDAPELDPNGAANCYGAEAADRARNLLDGKFVMLETDASAGAGDDPNSLAVNVWLPDGSLFNLQMVAEGYAILSGDATSSTYANALSQAEAAAREGGIGLWSPQTCEGQIDREPS
jgi:micrococcal nuclease